MQGAGFAWPPRPLVCRILLGSGIARTSCDLRQRLFDPGRHLHARLRPRQRPRRRPCRSHRVARDGQVEQFLHLATAAGSPVPRPIAVPKCSRVRQPNARCVNGNADARGSESLATSAGSLPQAFRRRAIERCRCPGPGRTADRADRRSPSRSRMPERLRERR
jgi:hypothetical protein